MHGLVIMFLLTLVTTTSFAADFDVTPVSGYLPEYKGKYIIILRTIETSNAPLPERLELYEQEMNKLKLEFKTRRRAEYKAVQVARAVRKSCTNGAGGKKDCGEGSVTIESSNLYTREELLSVVGTNKGTRVSRDGRTAYLKMTKAGKGRNVGTLTAKFEYRPEVLEVLAEQDMIELFKKVAQK